MDKSWIKMHDKFSKMLRIEATTNYGSFSIHYREVEHRDGNKTMESLTEKKLLYSYPIGLIIQGFK